MILSQSFLNYEYAPKRHQVAYVENYDSNKLLPYSNFFKLYTISQFCKKLIFWNGVVITKLKLVSVLSSKISSNGGLLISLHPFM